MTARRLAFPRAVAGALAAVLTLALAVSPVHADTSSKLKSAKDDLHALESQIADEQDQIDSLRSQAQDLAEQIDQVQTKQARTQSRIVDLQQQILDANNEMQATQDQLNRRAWVAYEQGVGSNLEFLLGSTSLSDLTLRLQIVDNAVQSDQDLITQIQDQKTQLQARKSKLGDLEEDLVAQGRDLGKKNDQIQSKLDDANAIQQQLDADQADAQKQVNDLQKQLDAEQAAAEAARLAALAKDQGSGGAVSGSGGGGGWVSGIFKTCPVPGAVYSDDFGAPRYGGGYHLHAGNDMFQSMGAPIYAPFAGTVEDASNGLGGISLKVFGSDGYVYNAHLSKIADGILGKYVAPGTLIGYVGDTGDAQGGATHDHFEWHPNVIPKDAWVSLVYHYSVIGSAIDPYPYLNSVC